MHLITTTYNIPNSSSGSTQLRSAPLGFEYTGRYIYYNGSFGYADSQGRYWSQSVYSSTNTYTLNFNSNNVYPQINDDRGQGFAVRCVAR